MTFDRDVHSVVWEITRLCNLSCAHCASSAGHRREEELTTEEALALCDDLAGIGAQAVCLFGGEFFLRPDWEEIARRLRSHDIEVSGATNGWAMDEALCEKFLALEMGGISVSLDAAEPEVHDSIRGRSGSHERALRAMRLLDTAGLQGKTVITSVTRTNLDQIDRMPELILSCIDDPDWMWMINCASCHDPNRFGEGLLLDLDDYLNLVGVLNRLRPAYGGRLEITGSHDLGYFSWNHPDIANFRWQGCRAGIDTLGIHSDGRVKGCLILPDRFVEGNLRIRGIIDMWRDPDSFALVRKFTTDLLEGECAGCAFGEVCKGGCKDIAASYTGSPYHFPFCLHREEMRGK